jgi:hypothetical protein
MVHRITNDELVAHLREHQAFEGNQIHLDSARTILRHLATNELLTHRVAGNKSYVGYGAMTVAVVRNAGITMPVTAAA